MAACALTLLMSGCPRLRHSSFYWSSKEVTAEIVARYPTMNLVVGASMDGLIVPAGDLAFSVIIFAVAAVACLSVITARRIVFGAELGSRMRWPTFACLIGLWLLYVSLSTWKAYQPV